MTYKLLTFEHLRLFFIPCKFLKQSLCYIFIENIERFGTQKINNMKRLISFLRDKRDAYERKNMIRFFSLLIEF